jgi:hypothetical protein
MMSIKWGLSVPDWRDHAIEAHHDHPTGVHKSTVRAFADDGYPVAGQIVRGTMPGMRERDHRDRFATLRYSDRPPG